MQRVQKSATFVAFCLVYAGAARAEPGNSALASGVTPEGTRPAVRGEPLPPWFIPEGHRPVSLGLSINPVSLATGRFGATFELLVAPHHAVVGTPYFLKALPGRSDEMSGNELEVGYRLYSGRMGPHGWYIGASALLGTYRYSSAELGAEQSWDSVGFALDAGYQFLIGGHFVFGAGLGAQYKYYPIDPKFEEGPRSLHSLVWGGGLRPRLTLAIGGAI